MSLAEKLKTTSRSESGLPCGMLRLLSEIEGDDKEALEAVLSQRSRSGTISNRQIHAILLGEGHDIAFASISMHRRQQCRCFVGKNSETRQEILRKDA